MTFHIDTASAGATGQLCVLARRDISMRFAIELDQLLQHDRPGRHVDAQRQCLGREDDLDQPAYEGLLDTLLECGQHAGMMRGYSPTEGLGEEVVVEGVEITAR